MTSLAATSHADLEIQSAGTHDYHVGDRPDPRMTNACQQRGYAMVSRARHLVAADLVAGQFDRIVAMDRENLAGIERLAGNQSTKHVQLFSDFLVGDWPDDVPDPYYGGADGFAYVLDMLEAGCPALLNELCPTT